ncbi:Tat (twin-arginine translocation) pathway signal sequence [Rhizobiales bacterium GAS191]|nr:Tat (twin-arginine translocation) pathway signal sequence [Rhizobiales bacterium GAS191]
MGSVGNKQGWSVTRRDFLQTTGAIATAVGSAPALSAPFVPKAFAETKALTQDGGHLYMQTNETRNAVIHYLRSASGTITEVERIPTGASGSGVFRPIYEAEGPNAFEGAGSVILTSDRRFLFTTNGGDNSASSFSVGKDGRLTLLDVKPTGNAVKGKSGTAKSLAYCASTGTLYVLHSFGPDHVRLMSVNGEGKLTARPERYSVNTQNKTDRVSTMAVLSPDQKFLLVDINFDERPSTNPDGTLKVAIANERDPDGLVIFPVGGDGTLGAPSFHDAGGAAPFYIAFLHGRPNNFINGIAAGNGLVMSSIDADGRIGISRLVPLDTSAGKPSELCWLAISPDDRSVFTTNFGYSDISSYRIDGDEVSIAKDPACPKVPGDGTFRAINGIVSSGPSDNWITPDGAYLYQIYGNASKLVGYATQPDGSLNEITSVRIPYNSPQGLAGF